MSLLIQFQEVLGSFFKGVKDATRQATREYLEDYMGEPVLVLETLPCGGLKSTASAVFADGSGFETAITQFANSKVGHSFTFVASTAQAMSAMVDMASAAFTEMDSMALANGLAK